jgi:hypothetical protein
MSESGQKRRLDCRPVTSGLPHEQTFAVSAGMSQTCQQRKSWIPGFFILRASYRKRALSSLSSLRLLQLSGASRDSGHPV